VLAPLPAHWTGLREIAFAEGDCPNRLVVEQMDELAGIGGTDLLRLHLLRLHLLRLHLARRGAR
jgi:hypothetical protein